MDLWKMESSVTAAIATSVKTPAVTTPMRRRAKNANLNQAKSAGQIFFCAVFFWWNYWAPNWLMAFLKSRLHICNSFSRSPSQGPCCTPECAFKGTDAICRPESECALDGHCNGLTAMCPTSEPKENHTSCHSETQVCLNGVGKFFFPRCRLVSDLTRLWACIFSCFFFKFMFFSSGTRLLWIGLLWFYLWEVWAWGMYLR